MTIDSLVPRNGTIRGSPGDELLLGLEIITDALH
jgi:hypothetical protein